MVCPSLHHVLPGFLWWPSDWFQWFKLFLSSTPSSCLTPHLILTVTRMLPFTSFSCRIAVVRTSNTMLNKSGESGHPCFVPDFRGNVFSFSLLSMMLAVELIRYMAFIMFKYVPSIPTFWGVFFKSQLDVEFSQKFLCIFCANHMFFIFSVLMGCITLIDFQILNHPCMSWISPIWSWYMILLMYCGSGLWIFCWGFVHWCSSELACNFLFLWYHQFFVSG